MTVGELFITLGLKGANKVGEGLSSVSRSMENVQTTSIETKAAILGLVYGLEHFMSKSAELGMTLQQFSNYTGLSIDSLQRWQIAGKQAGVSADEMESSIKGVQKAIAEMQLGQGPPGGLAMIARYTGGLDLRKLNDTFYILEKMKTFAQSKDVPLPFANYFMNAAHMSDNMVQFLRTTKVDLKKIDPNLIASDSQVHQLAKISVAWDMLGMKVQRAFDRLTAKHGLTIVAELSKVTDQVTKLISQFTKLAESLKVFQLFSKVFEGWGMIFEGINKALGVLNKNNPGLEKFFDQNDIEKEIGDKNKHPQLAKISSKIKDVIPEAMYQADQLFEKFAQFVAPTTPSHNVNSSSQTTINQNITHYGDAKDTAAVKSTHGAAARQANQKMAEHHSKEAARYVRNSPGSLVVN